MKLAFALAPILLVGCASSKDYAAFLAAQQSVAVQHAEAAKSRYQAMALIANSGDASSKTAAVMAMAMVQQPNIQLPPPPEGAALKWASVLLPAITNLGSGYFGYRLGVTQSNNAASTTIAGYNTFGTMATAGYAALADTSSAGFAANNGIATAGFGSNATLGSFIQAPQPNVTLSGTGVIGSGTYSAPVTTTTTTTSNSNNTSRNCQGGGGAGGGGGGSGDVAGAGAAGGSGGSANC